MGMTWILRTTFTLLCCCVILGQSTALAQTPGYNDAATEVFEDALRLFDAGNYSAAAYRFSECFQRFPLHTYTTAAILMQGKSLYREGQYPAARRAMESFVQNYPTSSYVDEAVRILSYITEISRFGEMVTIGVLLPAGSEDASLSSSITTGLLHAVDEHNVSGTELNVKVRLVFRESSNSRPAVMQALQELKDSGAELVVGPLYSDEADAAAEAAEALRIALIAPLATDDGITKGRRYTFQANPSIETRGKVMAQFAINALRLRSFAIIAEQSSDIGDRMASGFEDEVLRLGGSIDISDRLPGSNNWFKLNERYSSDAFNGVEAVYLPVTGGNAQTLAKGAMDSLDRLNVRIRILGNKEWANLSSAMQASQYDAVYSTDYDLEQSRRVEDFRRQYESRFGSKPNSLAFVGYDIGSFALLQLFAQRSAIRDAIANSNYYQGLSATIDFQGGNINQALTFFRYRNGQIERLR